MSDIDTQGENCYRPAVENLSAGLVSLYQSPLQNINKQLKELSSKQNILISHIHDENLSLAEAQYSSGLQDMFKKMTEYQGKLVNIKKDMRQLRDKSIKLKKRAEKLQQIKEKENQMKEQAQLDIQREEELIGPGPSTS
ncbi:biogenesis of lysosome-related organelles complex 1 subunit 6-like [Leptinotarsa decemlineata]|uniref:biogenesis of lysosome-related organelles complex 1 subunit 6-like n=1 Tax=Leptinotarsa decemlineata TaxID=7539 RepID=UPI003D303E96